MPADDPGWIDPMLASSGAGPFSDPDWIFEPKLDGVRGLAYRHGHGVELWTRNRKPLGPAHPELLEALAAQTPTEFVLDGEVVAFDHGRPSFSRLQSHPAQVSYVVFDVLSIDGRRLTSLPLTERRQVLESRLASAGPVVVNTAIVGDGQALFDEMCRRGWEGVVAKRAASPYVSRRSRDWLKVKCGHGQEVVVGGFTEPKGHRTGLGALLVGVYDGDQLRYAGKVGTGFSQRVLVELRAQLETRERPTSPFADERIPERGPRWVEPELVAEVTFSEWTTEGRLRHPVFQGLRDDKDARQVVRE
jgi:bifunctional non-homologous end joining protein LigD